MRIEMTLAHEGQHTTRVYELTQAADGTWTLEDPRTPWGEMRLTLGKAEPYLVTFPAPSSATMNFPTLTGSVAAPGTSVTVHTPPMGTFTSPPLITFESLLKGLPEAAKDLAAQTSDGEAQVTLEAKFKPGVPKKPVAKKAPAKKSATSGAASATARSRTSKPAAASARSKATSSPKPSTRG